MYVAVNFCLFESRLLYWGHFAKFKYDVLLLKESVNVLQ